MSISPNICLSGGAEGADQQWGMTAGLKGHQVIHWSFEKHKTHVPESEVVPLTEEQLLAADPALDRARKVMGRGKSRTPYVMNLLRRNYYQVRDAERVYAVASLAHKSVEGGTGYAVTMFLQRSAFLPCECYVFDQDVEKWFAWKGEWVEIECPPKPHGIWAGIGSRKLTPAGKRAIRDLMDYDPERDNPFKSSPSGEDAEERGD